MWKIGIAYKEKMGHTVRLVLEEWTRIGDEICLSPECRTIEEVEHYADRLKTTIDEAVGRARQEFAKPLPPLPPANR